MVLVIALIKNSDVMALQTVQTDRMRSAVSFVERINNILMNLSSSSVFILFFVLYITACNLYTEFSCHDSSRCIPREQVCDRFADCDDGSDEEGDGAKCSKHEFYQLPRCTFDIILGIQSLFFNLQCFL